MIDAGRFSAMAVDCKNIIKDDRNDFLRDIAVGAWKQRWVLSRRWCVGITIDECHADMALNRCRQEVS